MARDDITYIGVTNFRSTNQKFGITDSARLQHLYVLGKSGTGKTTLLKNMAISDMRRGNGLCVIDAHADMAQDLTNHVPKHRARDLIYFDVTNDKNPIAFNPLYNVPAKYHHLVASGIVSTFKKIWSESWGPRMEYILRFALLTLLCVPAATLLDIQPLLTDKEYRNAALRSIGNEDILSFWLNEFDKYSPTLRNEAIAPILNKTGLFITSTPLRNIVGQKTSSFRLAQVLNKRQILIVNLSKGQIGEEASSLLGALIISGIQNAALFRATEPEDRRVPFYLYIDECQSYITLAFTGILSEARKFGLSLFLAHQYIEQLDERIRAAIFGNVGTMIVFRVGSKDAEYLAREFYPVFNEQDFVHLPKYSMYLKLMIDGTVSMPFSAYSLPIAG